MVVTVVAAVVAAVIATASHARCTRQHVQAAVTKLRSLSSHAKTALFIAATAISLRVPPHEAPVAVIAAEIVAHAGNALTTR
jgi:hypothetical protein